MNLRNRFFPILFAVIPVTWAGSFIAGKYVVFDMTPIESVFWRFILSAAALLPFLALFNGKRHLNFKDPTLWYHFGWVVFFAGIGYHVFFFWGLESITPTRAALIIALNPFFTAIGEALFLRKPRSLRFYLGFLLAFSGAIWVNVARGAHFDFSNLGKGELLCFLAALCWSVYAIMAKRTKKDHWDSLWINGYGYLFTAVLLIPIMADKLAYSHLAAISAPTWFGQLYMAIFPTAIGYTLFYVGVQKKGPAWASTYIYFVPSFTALLDHLFFRAMVTPPMVIGTALVVTGLVLGNVTLRRPPR